MTFLPWLFDIRATESGAQSFSLQPCDKRGNPLQPTSQSSPDKGRAKAKITNMLRTAANVCKNRGEGASRAAKLLAKWEQHMHQSWSGHRPMTPTSRESHCSFLAHASQPEARLNTGWEYPAIPGQENDKAEQPSWPGFVRPAFGCLGFLYGDLPAPLDDNSAECFAHFDRGLCEGFLQFGWAWWSMPVRAFALLHKNSTRAREPILPARSHTLARSMAIQLAASIKEVCSLAITLAQPDII